MRVAVCALLLVACGRPEIPAPPDTDILGPFTGPITRYSVDQILLPPDHSYYVIDLNGDGRPDNAFGNIVGALAQNGDAVDPRAISDQIAVGRLSPYVELRADSLDDDPAAGLTFYSARGAPGFTVGGKIVDGTFSSNKPAITHHPVSGGVVVPALAAADPLVLDAIALYAKIRPAGDYEPPGLTLELHGAVRPDDLWPEVYRTVAQQIAAQPGEHPKFAELDTNFDDAISYDELRDYSVLQNILAPDVGLLDENGNYAPWANQTRKDSISFGLAFHLVPCPQDPCPVPTVINTCDDRIVDGRETDVDCGGGACSPCGPNLRCVTANDCNTGACQGGFCAPATCHDGHVDGLEKVIDCGVPCRNESFCP